MHPFDDTIVKQDTSSTSKKISCISSNDLANVQRLLKTSNSIQPQVALHMDVCLSLKSEFVFKIELEIRIA